MYTRDGGKGTGVDKNREKKEENMTTELGLLNERPPPSQRDRKKTIVAKKAEKTRRGTQHIFLPYSLQLTGFLCLEQGV